MRFIYQKINAKVLTWFLLAVFSASIFLVVFSIIIPPEGYRPAKAATCTWQASEHSTWNSSGNWSCGSVPGSSDTVVFDDTSDFNCNFDTTGVTITALQLNSGYDGILDLNSNSLTVNGNVDVADANATLDLDASTLTVVGLINYTAGTITPGTSTVVHDDDYGTTWIGTYSLNDFEVDCWRGTGGRFKVNDGDTLTIGGTLTLTDGQVDDGGTLTTSGNIVQGAGFDGGAETLTLDGGAGQTFTINGGIGPKYVFNNSNLDITPGASWTANQITLTSGTFNESTVTTTINGTVFTVNGGTYTTGSGDGGLATTAEYGTTFTGNVTVNNFTINNSRGSGGSTKINAGDTMTVNGTFTMTNGQVDAGGTLDAKGTVVQESGFDGGAEIINLNAAGAQTFTINGGTGPGYTFNNSNLNVTPGADWAVGALTLTSGTLNGGTSVTTTITSDFTLDGGTFTAQTGEVVLTKNGGPTVTGNVTFNDLTLNLFRNYQNATFTGGTANVAGTLTLTKGMIAGTLNSQGDITLSSGFGGYTVGTGGSGEIIVNGSSTQTLTGNATTSAGAIPDIDIQNDLNITGTVRTLDNWTYTSGTVDAGSSTVVFGNADMTIDSNGMSFFNVTLNAATATSDTTLASNIDIDGTLLISSNGELETTATDYSVTVGVFTMTGGNFDANDSTVTCEGNWSAAGGTFTGTGSTLQFTTSGSDFFDPGSSTYKNVTVNKAAITDSVTFLNNGLTMAASSTLTITTGIFYLAGQALDVGSSSTTSIGTLGVFMLVGNESLSNVSNSTAATSGTVSYVGTGTYASGLIVGDSYYKLRINGDGGTWILDAALDINNDLTITQGTLDVKDGSNYDVNIAGDWSNSGIFEARSGDVIFDSGSTQTINAGGTGDGDKDFNDLTVSGSTLQLTSSGLEVDVTLTISSGKTLDLNALPLTAATIDNPGTILLQGDETVSITVMDTAEGLVKYDGTGTYSSGLAVGNTYYNLEFDGSGGTWTLGAPLVVSNNLTITQGTLDTKAGNNYQINVGNNWSNSSIFTAQSGEVIFDATDSGNTITRGSSSFYDLTFNGSSGEWTIQDALDVDYDLTITQGTLDTKSGSNYQVNVGHDWSNAGTFTSNTSKVVFDGSTAQTITTGGTGATQDFQDLQITNTSAAVSLAANAIDIDGALTIDTSATFDINGQNATVTGTFSNSGTFKLLGTEATVSITNDATAGLVTYDGTGATGLKMGNNYYDLTFSGTSTPTWTLGAALDVNNDLTIAASNTLDVSGTGYDINVGKNFANSGTFTAQTGDVIFDTAAKTSVISGSTTFYDFTVPTSAATKTLQFTAGTTQTVTNSFSVTGTTPTNWVNLHSTIDESAWNLCVTGESTSTDYVEVKDSNAIPSENCNPITPDNYNVAGSVRNTGWFNSAPFIGYDADNVIPVERISQSSSVETIGVVTIQFRAKDADTGDTVTLTNFQYYDGTEWSSLDSSDPLGGDWPNKGGAGFATVTSWSGDAHSFTFNTKHEDVPDDNLLTSTDISDFKVRFQATDGTATSAVATSVDQILDNVAPVVATPITLTTPTAGITFTLDAAFEETNPTTNTYAYNLVLGGVEQGYTNATGEASVADPDAKEVTLGSDIDGNDYFTAIKITHTDAYANSTTSENTTNVYVTPYTPQQPTVDNILTDELDLTIEANDSEATGLDYLIYATDDGTTYYVQADGSLLSTSSSANEDWNTMTEWQASSNGTSATINVTGLSSPDSAQFKVKSRNSADGGSGTESSYSTESSPPGYPRPNTPGAPTLSNPSGSTSSINLAVNTTVTGYGDPDYCIRVVDGDSSTTYASSSGGVYTAAAASCTYYSYSTLEPGIEITGLSINTQYSISLRAQEGVLYTNFSPASSLYTLAVTPGTPTKSSLDTTSVTLALGSDTNPSTTQYAIKGTAGETALYANVAGAWISEGPVWQTASEWGTVEITGLGINTQYTFQVGAQNGNSVPTAYTGLATNFYTLANAPGTPSLPTSSITGTSLGLTLDTNSNPASTEFAIYETTTGQYVQTTDGTLSSSTDYIWQISSNWGSTVTITGLSPVTSYTFKVNARNGDSTETDFSSTASQTTQSSGPSVAPSKQEEVITQETSSPTFAPAPEPDTQTPVASATSIKWYFDESSINEQGFKLKDDSGEVLKTSNTPNLSYLEESDLTPNTYYQGRTIVAFNSVGEAESQEFGGVWTLAAEPTNVRLVPVSTYGTQSYDWAASALSDSSPAPGRMTGAVKLMFDSNGNPDYTKYLIREENTGRYLNQSGEIQLDPYWLTYTNWSQPAGLLITSLVEGGSYTFAVKARNEEYKEVVARRPIRVISLDTTAPDKPIITYPAEGSILETNLVGFTGTAEANSSVILYLEGKKELQYTCPVDETGVFSCTLTAEEGNILSSGDYSLKAKTQDQSLNLSEYSPTISFSLDLPPELEPEGTWEEEEEETLTPEEALEQLEEGLKEREIDVSLDNSTFLVEPSILRVGDTATLTVTLKDKSNNPLTGHELKLISSSYDDLITGDPSHPTGYSLTNELGQTVFSVTSDKAHTSLISIYDQTEDYLLTTLSLIFEPHVPGILLVEADNYDLKPKGLLTLKDTSEITFTLYDEYYNLLAGDEYTLNLSLDPALGSLDEEILTIKNGQAQTIFHAPRVEDIPSSSTLVSVIAYLEELEIRSSLFLNLTRPKTEEEERQDFRRQQREGMIPEEGVFVELKKDLLQAPNDQKQMTVVADEPFTISFKATGPVRKVSVFILNEEHQMYDLDKDGIYTYDYIISKVYKNQEVPMLILEERPTGKVQVSPASLLVDPYGYVYEVLTKSQIDSYSQKNPSLGNILKKLEDQEIKIADATVILFYQDPVKEEWIKWPAEEFEQHNPLRTNQKGEYAFMVPPGQYYLRVVKDDYELYVSRRFEVEEAKPLNLNIKLLPSAFISLQKIQTILNLIGVKTNLPDDVLIPLLLLILNLVLGLPLIGWGYKRYKKYSLIKKIKK